MKRILLPAAFALVALDTAQAQQLTGSSTASESVAAARAGTSVRSAALDRRITLRLTNAPLAVALEQIARAADMGFIYSRDIVPPRHQVSLEAEALPAADALERVLTGTGLTYAVTGAGQLTVLRAKPPARKAQIVGTVVLAASRAPLSDVYVQIEGTNRGTRTNDRGEFTLREVDPGTYDVSARRVGLARSVQRVTVSGDTSARVDFAMKETASQLDQVVVTSSVAETQMRAVPVDVTVITSEMIREKNITNVQQLFRGDIPGIFMEDQGIQNTNPTGSRTPQVRGQNFLSGQVGATSSLKVYLDGVLLSDQSIIAQLDPNTIDRMEVIRGPAATTMYGSGASDGVVQIFTKRGTSSARPRVTVGLSAQAFDSPYQPNTVVSPRAEVSLTGGGDQFSYNASANFERQGEWVPDYESNRKNFSLGLRWDNGPVTLSASVLADGPNSYNNVYFNEQGPFWRLGLQEGWISRARLEDQKLVPGSSVSSAKSLTTGVTLQYRPTTTWNHSLTVGSNSYTVRTEKERPTYVTPDDSLLSFINSMNGSATINYSNTWLYSPVRWLRSTLTSGFEHTDGATDYTSLGGISELEGSWYASTSTYRVESRNTGYFGQSELAFAERFYLTTGVRAEKNPNYGKDVGLNIAPRFGGAYVQEVGQATVKLRAAYGWASRPPQSYQRKGRPTTSYTSGNNIYYTHTLANPDLEPAKSRGGDFGTDITVGNWLNFSATYFRQFAEKDAYSETTRDTVALEPPFLELHDYNMYRNVGEVETRGWEARGRVNWREWFASGTYSPVDNIVRSLPKQGVLTGSYANLAIGDRMENIPRYTASTMIGYSGRRTQANLSSTIQGHYRGNDLAAGFRTTYGIPEVFGPGPGSREIEFPRWVKYDLNVSHQVLQRVQAYVRVQNLFDNRIVEGYQNVLPESGRIFTIGTRWTSY